MSDYEMYSLGLLAFIAANLFLFMFLFVNHFRASANGGWRHIHIVCTSSTSF